MQNKRVNSIQISEPKVRVKMWKSKKRWVCGAVLYAAMGIGMSTTHSVSAAPVDEVKPTTTAPNGGDVAPEVNKDSGEAVPINKKAIDHELGLLTGKYKKISDKPDLTDSSEDFKAGYTEGLVIAIKQKMVEVKIADDARKVKEAEEAKKKADALLEIQKLADVPTKLIEAANSLKNGNILVSSFGGADVEEAAKNHEQVAKNKAKVQVGIHTITTAIENVEKNVDNPAPPFGGADVEEAAKKYNQAIKVEAADGQATITQIKNILISANSLVPPFGGADVEGAAKKYDQAIKVKAAGSQAIITEITNILKNANSPVDPFGGADVEGASKIAKERMDALLERQKSADVPTKLIEVANSLKNGNILVSPFGGADVEGAAKNHEQVVKLKVAANHSKLNDLTNVLKNTNNPVPSFGGAEVEGASKSHELDLKLEAAGT